VARKHHHHHPTKLRHGPASGSHARSPITLPNRVELSPSKNLTTPARPVVLDKGLLAHGKCSMTSSHDTRPAAVEPPVSSWSIHSLGLVCDCVDGKIIGRACTVWLVLDVRRSRRQHQPTSALVGVLWLHHHHLLAHSLAHSLTYNPSDLLWGHRVFSIYFSKRASSVRTLLLRYQYLS